MTEDDPYAAPVGDPVHVRCTCCGGAKRTLSYRPRGRPFRTLKVLVCPACDRLPRDPL